tara:strand:- start:441 stop:1217 length:777 start_codon:yes stop_codon:yes gene_type:complete
MHISYSELKTWAECTWRHKLEYLDKLKLFKGNEYTSFGKALHSVGEKFVLEETSDITPEDYFELQFLNELKYISASDKETSFDQKLIADMRKQGVTLSTKIIPALEEHFDTFEVISVEEKLYEDIDDSELKFKGFIDLVVKKNDIYYILDWKTCSWGWRNDKKRDQLVTYQLTLYKHYFAKKHNIDPKNIKTCFGLLKRTAKKNQVEIFEVSSGLKKTENALNLLKKALYNIDNKRFIKNKLSCRYCPFNDKPKLCKK